MTEIKTLIQEKEKEVKDQILQNHQSYLPYYSLTKTQPAIYFVPRKLDEWSQTTFGFTIPLKETVIVNNNDTIDDIGEDNPNNRDVEIENVGEDVDDENVKIKNEDEGL